MAASPRSLDPTILSKVDIKHVVKLILYFPVVADGMEDTLAILYRADVIRHLEWSLSLGACRSVCA